MSSPVNQSVIQASRKGIPELADLEEILGRLESHCRIEILAQPQLHGQSFPIYGISLGSTSPSAPTVGLFGGVHGLERIGSQVVIAYLETIRALLEWDHLIQNLLSQVRLVFVPIINPIGMRFHRRSNGRGVDLMRNAPVDAEGPTWLVGGQRISPLLPWYRGESSSQMEIESQAVCDFVRKQMFQSRVSIALDVHSGFGFKDRIWFPYAKTRNPFPHLSEAFALKEMMDRTLPNHVYQYEPQAGNYVTHGDFWDFLYDEHRKDHAENIFMPLTLEMGSWQWIRKNPVQGFSFLGFFNPVKPHRKRRILRRHLPFLDFLIRAIGSSDGWAHLQSGLRDRYEVQAKQLWYNYR